DGGGVKLGVLIGAARAHFPGGKEEIEAEDMLAEGSFAPRVLAVDVGGSSAANGNGHNAGDDGGHPAIGKSVAPELFDGGAWLNGDLARGGIPGEDAVHQGGVEDDGAGVEGGVAVAAARTAQGDRATVRGDLTKDSGNLVRRAGTDDAALGTAMHAVAFQ